MESLLQEREDRTGIPRNKCWRFHKKKRNHFTYVTVDRYNRRRDIESKWKHDLRNGLCDVDVTKPSKQMTKLKPVRRNVVIIIFSSIKRKRRAKKVIMFTQAAHDKHSDSVLSWWPCRNPVQNAEQVDRIVWTLFPAHTVQLDDNKHGRRGGLPIFLY